jgi:hypothetical protein
MTRARTLQAIGLTLLVAAGAGQVVGQTAATASGRTTVPKAPPTNTSDGFSKDQLEQLVAPIALYSDALLAQMLMAATYPLEIVLADRFVKANANLKDSKLDEALKEYDWDASVKSLCRLPDVLARMSENLDWTQDLGDAVLGQKTELLDAVQRMRGKAYDSGNLKTSEQQVVTVKEEKIIVIESPSPEVVYVPTYSPTVVYGGWAPPYWYYPPMYPYYPYGAGLVTFGFGVAMGAAIWGGCGWGWGHSDIDINVDHHNNFNRNTNRNSVDHHRGAGDRGGRSSWNHDPSHRRGANYQNSKVASQYGGRGGSSRVSRDQARGFGGERTGTREARTPGGGNRAGTAEGSAGGNRGGGADRPGAADRAGSGQRAGAADRAGGGNRSSVDRTSGNRSSYGSRNGAYSGSSRPSVDRGSSSRGSASRGSRSYGGSRGGGGGGRGGGGRGGGGRRN